MVTKKTTKALKKSEYEEVLAFAKALMKEVKDSQKWCVTREKKIAALKKIVEILNRLPEPGKRARSVVFDSKKDEGIIRRFMERHNLEHPKAEQANEGV